MKTIIDRFLEAKTWQERAAIAENKHPVTPFNSVFERADRAMQFAKWGNSGNAQREAMTLGAVLAETISKRDWKTLKKMSAALYDWKFHEPKPDYVLIVLASMGGMFPPGWLKKWRLYKRRRGSKDALSYADILKRVEKLDPDLDERSPEADLKKIQRYAKKLGITLTK